MIDCEHKNTYGYRNECGRVQGNNYDLVTYVVRAYCDDCGEASTTKKTVRENIAKGYKDVDEQKLASPARYGT